MNDKGCHNCIHHLSKLNEDLKGCSYLCKLGHQDACSKWWLDNGTKKYGEDLIPPTCEAHDYPEHLKILDKMNDTASRILDELKEINSK